MNSEDTPIGIGYDVMTPHGKGTVVEYEIYSNDPITYTQTPPTPQQDFRYVIELHSGHTWSLAKSSSPRNYAAFPRDVQILMGQF